LKAFIVERYGRKDGVRFGDMPEPELRDDDILVRVPAAGVNPAGFQNPQQRIQAHPAISLAAH
jgi:NADPH:quinone reductase-like Zn-dependent oxidoreductase